MEVSENSLNNTNDTYLNTDYYEMLVESTLTQEQQNEIQKYSGGKTPAELIEDFCLQANNGELDRMVEDIQQSYNYNPASPAAIMSVFKSMGNLCPE